MTANNRRIGRHFGEQLRANESNENEPSFSRTTSGWPSSPSASSENSKINKEQSSANYLTSQAQTFNQIPRNVSWPKNANFQPLSTNRVPLSLQESTRFGGNEPDFGDGKQRDPTFEYTPEQHYTTPYSAAPKQQRPYGFGRVEGLQVHNYNYQRRLHQGVGAPYRNNDRNPYRLYLENNVESRPRRQKFMPEDLGEVDLFSLQEQIIPGDCFAASNATDMESEIVITGGDNTRPLIHSFDECGFSEALMKNITLKNYEIPTLIQRAVIPLVMRKKKYNIIGHAPTGSGKTAAFILPLIDEIHLLKARTFGSNAIKSASPYVIIISPTKELAQQLYNDARTFASGSIVVVARSYGDMPMARSINEVRRGCDIFIATCGRLQHFVDEKIIQLENLHYLILDEADLLISAEFVNTINFLKQQEGMPLEYRTLMFSATFDPQVQTMCHQLLGINFFFVRVGRMNSVVNTVSQQFIEVGKFDKLDKLTDIMKEIGKVKPKSNGDYFFETPKTLVFVEEKRNSDRVGIALCQEKFKVLSLNSDRTLQQRHEAVRNFTKGVFTVLVATDVAARGPLRKDKVYIHRIGRTGRAGNRGRSLSFFDSMNAFDCEKASFYIQMLQDVGADVPGFLRRALENGPLPSISITRSYLNAADNNGSQKPIAKPESKPENVSTAVGSHAASSSKTNQKQLPTVVDDDNPDDWEACDDDESEYDFRMRSFVQTAVGSHAASSSKPNQKKLAPIVVDNHNPDDWEACDDDESEYDFHMRSIVRDSNVASDTEALNKSESGLIKSPTSSATTRQMFEALTLTNYPTSPNNLIACSANFINPVINGCSNDIDDDWNN